MEGEHEMRVLWSVYGSHGVVEPVEGLAVRLRTFGTPVCAPSDCAVPEECDALATTGVVPAGVWR
jgi:hypothetical protein